MLLPSAAGLCLIFSLATRGEGHVNSLDSFNDEDIAELGDQPEKGMDSGLILDKLFNKNRRLPGATDGSSNLMGSLNSRYNNYANSNSRFSFNRGNEAPYGLNYGTNNEWGGGGNTGFNGMGGMYTGPMAGQPMFLQPNMVSVATEKPAKGGDGEGTTTASPDGATANTTKLTSTMSPLNRMEALVQAFGGGEKARVQQMGPPIIVPVDSAPTGLRGVGRLPQKPIVVKPGETMPMYGRIVLGPPKFAQAVDMNARGGWNHHRNNSAELSLTRFNKPADGFSFSNSADTGSNVRLGGNSGQRSRFGFRSIEAYDPPASQERRPPPVIKYVPVVETVRRRRMKAILVDPV